jgi:deoxyribodipyrimidine photolyase-related protein
MAELRALIIVLGDQLDLDAAAFDGFDAGIDAVWMAEVAEESTHVWSSKPRTVLFLAAMRHFALALQSHGRPLHYTRLDAPGSVGSLAAQLQADILRLRPARLVMTAPGDWRVLQAIKAVAEAKRLPLDIREDRHYFCSIADFAAHAKGRKSLRMEYFYREQRRRHDVLMQGNEPAGGQWNFDADNREAFGAAGPGAVPPRTAFETDTVTREVIALVEERFADHPGRLDSFCLAGYARAGAAIVASLHPRALAAVWSLPGCHVAWRPVAISLAPVGRAER